MKNYSKYICLFLLLVGMSFNAWGADETLTVTGTFIGGSSSYGSSSGKNLATSASHNVEIAYTDVLQGQTYLQLKASTGVLYSKSLPASSSNNIIKTITIATVSGNSIKLYGSTATNNTGWSEISYTANSAADVSSCSYKTFKVESSGGWASTPSVTVVYTEASPHTITFNAGNGSCGTSTSGSVTSYTLPSATPATNCGYEGWVFAGWKEGSAQSETTSFPVLYAPGTTYSPASDITLYAVYYQPSTSYKKITSTDHLLKGCNYVWAIYYDSEVSAAGDDKYWAFKNVANGNYITSSEVEPSTDVISSPSEDVIWELKGNSDAWQLYNADEELYIKAGTSPYLSASSENLKITESSGKFKIKNGTKYLLFYDDYTYGGNTKDEWNEYYVYRQGGTFATSPSCCEKIVELIDGDETNAILGGYSIDVFPTCSSTAADRQVTITVMPEDGYEFTSSARLEWTTLDGTFAENSPEYVSGPTDNGDGTYSFVYQFAQNDNGGGAFSVTATPINYTISFNANGGSGSMDNVVKAYGTTYDLPANGFTRPAGKMFKCWAQGSAGGTERAVGYTHTISGDITFYAVWRDAVYTEAKFSCAELTLTAKPATEGTPFFITSTASTTVRSQDSILIVGSGLTPNQALEFPGLDGKFTVKSRANGALSVKSDGTIDTVAYIFYNPGATTEDGLDKLTGITVKVDGAKPKTVNLTQDIIGRHLPADFVIACKRGSKWYALPANMSELTNPGLVEIAVDDINNPTVAYTATSNIYNLYGQSSGAGYLEEAGQYIKLGQKNNSNKPLFGSATGTSTIKGDGTAGVTSNLNKQYWWLLTQTKTGEVTAATAQYSISCANNTAPLVLKENAGNPQWGFYTTGSVGPLRIIPASESSVVFAEASVVAWGQHSAIIETDAGTGTVLATKVVGKLPEDIETTKKSISQTGTSVKGTGTRYNYTVNFGSGEGGIDFSANEGKMLTLEWYNSSDVLVAVSNVMVPRIVATNTTINKANYGTKGVWNTEVHVLPGDTLFIDASAYDKPNLTINELHVYPNATVQVLKDTLIVKNLIMRNGWNRLTAEKEYDVARLYIKSGTGNGTLKATNAYMDWYIDYDQYYPIAVPWQVATSAITYKNMTVAIDQGLIIRHYDGERHAKGGKDGDGNTNWKQYTWGDDMPENLVPGIGYAMTARRPAGKAFSIVRMPLTIPSAAWTTLGEQGEVSSVHKDQVSVTAWVKEEGETPKHAKGWNFIANPYMSIYEGAITHSVDAEYNIEYVNIPDVNFKEFEQLSTETTKLKPGSGFLIQTEETGMLTFGTTHRKASAPSYLAQTPKASKQKAYILLSGNEAFDQMGLIISDNYTADYEVNADLEKLLSDGNTLRTYMIYNNLNMAYVAINDTLAREWIPVSVRVPESGEYAFSLHSASKVSELEGIYLIDYTNNVVTNLIENNYSFMATEGTIAGRFAINAIVGKHDTPTDVDIINAGGDIKSNQPFKFIYNDKVFILHNGIIYDSTGKKVREIKK